MVPLSVIILTKNEEKNILDCLESLGKADEIIIVDDYSTDRTLEIIKNKENPKIKIFRRDLGEDFSAQRNFALRKATNEWVLFLDADERVDDKFIEEILFKANNKLSGFYAKRIDVMWGKELRFGETGNIALLRIIRKNTGRWEGRVHEEWKTKGLTEFLENAIRHYPHQTLREFIDEINFYTTLRAKELKGQNKKSSFFAIIFYTKGKFLKNYILQLGFLDGVEGLIFSIIMSMHSFLVRSKLFLLKDE